MTSRTSSNRRAAYKQGLNSSDCRRRREDTTLQLRKAKKEESLQKRRTMSSAPSNLPGAATLNQSQNASSSEASKTSFSAADIPMLMQNVQTAGNSQEKLLDAVRGFRKILSVEHEPPVDAVLECGIMPILVQLLSITGGDQCEMIQFEAAWALTNVASTDKTQAVVDHGALPALIQMLMSGNADVRDQSIWCLGNIAGDNPVLRDAVLAGGALPALLQNIAQPANASLLGNAAWALSNFCRGKPQVSLDVIGPAIPVLAGLIKDASIPNNVIVDACWALSYLSDGDDARIQSVMDTGVTETLVNLVQSNETRVITPCLRTLGNFVSGSDQQTQAVLDQGILSCMKDLLKNTKKSIRKESCWLLSNIAAGTKAQIQQITSYVSELKTVIESASNAEWEVRKEAIWVISNMCTGGTDENVQLLVEFDALEALCSVLTLSDPKITMVSLEAIENILKVGEKLGSIGSGYPRYLDEAGGIEKIEQLQEHENEEIYEKALHIIDTFLGGEEEENENLLPQTDGNQFVFGAPVPGKSMEGENDQMHSAPLQQFNFQSD